MNVSDRFRNGSGTDNDHTEQYKRSETFAKSRSRYGDVNVSKMKESLYSTSNIYIPVKI
jgi:hypothetical protein